MSSRSRILSPASRERRRISLVVAPLVVAATSGVLVAVRHHVDNSVVALVLGLIVVCSGFVGGQSAAVASSLAAAITFDLWHTQPFGSLKIDSVTDLVATLLLIVLGVVSGRVAERSWRHRDQ